MRKLKSFYLKLRVFKIVLRNTIRDFVVNYYHLKYHMRQSSDIKFSTLRMYCHMLDKGMNNIYFEKGHSLNIYNNAVALRNQLGSTYENDSAFKWVNEILSRFESAQASGKPELKLREPIVYTKEKIDEYTSFIINRTSCRNFLIKRIPDTVLEKIVKIAIDAPNGCCRQVVRYYITQDKEKIKHAVPHVAGITNFSNIQCLVCVAAETSYYDLIDKNLQFVDAALSAENFILGASLYGIYGTMCNIFHANKQDIEVCKNLFKVKETENIIMFIAMGYPISIPEKPTRRNTDSFFRIIDKS